MECPDWGVFTVYKIEEKNKNQLTSHFFVVHFRGIENGPVCERNFTSPSKSSFIYKEKNINHRSLFYLI